MAALEQASVLTPNYPEVFIELGRLAFLENRYADVDWETMRSSDIMKSSWYRRHRNAIETQKMHMRGMKVEVDSHSIEDKKIAIQKRIAKLRANRTMSVGA